MSVILRVAARGDGVTADGRFFALAAPGDSIGDDGSIIPGPHHAEPPCRHFPTCGGCQLQHLDDASYAEFLTDRVAVALSGQQLESPILPPHISPPFSRRRASLRAERRGRSVLLGFNEGRSHRIVDVAECHVLRPELFALVAPLRKLLAGLLPDRRGGEVRMTMADQGVDLLIEGIEAATLDTTEALTAFASAHELARLAIDDGYGPQTRWEPEPVTTTLGGVPVPLPPAAFLQATEDGEAALAAAVRAGIGDATVVADLFAGLGTFALALAEGRRVYAAEAARDAVLSLKAAGARAQLQLFADHRDLYRRPLDEKECARFEAVVLDPPRSGAEAQMPALAKAGPPRIAYASCNPATFARDAKVLVTGGYRLEQVMPVGQFRWSTHAELVGHFVR
ncbi:23S rRNA (uracil1939-C5)-methyltransferase [Sphingomonas zeicaulis]